MPKFMLRALGLVNPMMRELAEMSYEFEEPFVLDTSKFESTFGASATPLATRSRRPSTGTARAARPPEDRWTRRARVVSTKQT